MKAIYFVCAIFLCLVGCGPSLLHISKIEVTGDYYHDSSQIRFPERIDRFVRTDVTAFDDLKINVGVTYSLDDQNNNTKITIYIYPAPPPNEDRLLHEYIVCLQSISNVAGSDIRALQHYLRYSKDNFKVIGLSAQVDGGKDMGNTVLTVFECGTWFLKYRLTSSHAGSTALDSLQNKMLEVFSPTDLVKKHPLKQKSNILIAPAVFTDSSILYSTMYWAFNKAAWVLHNVDSLERSSGYPGLYLAEHASSILNTVRHCDSSRFGMLSVQREPFASLKKIVDSGYLNEFVMKEYDMLLVVPNDLKLDYEGYEKWKAGNLPNFSFRPKLFEIEYTE